MFHNYPYTDAHELNLDWIIAKIKHIDDTMKETEEFKEAAQAAQTGAETAQENAEIAQGKAEDAQEAAETAQGKAEDAQEAAETAQGKAEDAQEAAEAAAAAAVEDAEEVVQNTLNQINVLQARVDNIIPDGTQTEGNTELLDIRVAANGTIYSSAGDAVRGQITELEDALEYADLIRFPAVSWSDGYVLTDGTVSDVSSTWKKTAGISIPGGYTVVMINATGFTGSTLAAISTVAGDVYTSRVTGGSGQTTYYYTPATDMTVVFTAKQTADPFIFAFRNIKTITDNLKNSIDVNTADIANNTDSINSLITVDACEIYTTWINGVISPSGTLYDDPSWRRTEFKLNKGKTVSFTANGYERNACAMIARKNSDDTYTPLVISASGDVETYTYNCEYEDMTIVLSCLAASETRTVVISDNKEDLVSPYFSIFQKWGVIGDSFASGVFYDQQSGDLTNHLSKSWGQILARHSGNTCINFSKGGLYCGSWLTDNDRGLPFLLSSDPQELYIIALGINDVSRMGGEQPLGTISDIHEDYAENPATFYGNYGKIIGNIEDHAPNSKIVLSTIPYTTESAMQINDAILEIADHFSFPCLPVHTDSFFRSRWFWANMYDDHPKSFVYANMAVAYEKMIADSMVIDTSFWGDLFN